MNVILETPRLIIRKISLSDTEQLKSILGDPEVMRYSLKGALDESGIAEYVNKILLHYERHNYGLWVVILRETEQVIGLAGLIYQLVDDVPSVELVYRLARKYWGQGLATEAAKAIKEYAFNTLEIRQLISIIEPENLASGKVAIRVGMSRAKSTKFHEFNVDIYYVHKIVLLPYSQVWKEQYSKEEKGLLCVFGKLAIHFHHIGSTSIPGCYAKPIIDILGVTNDVLQIDAFNDSLEDVGYVALGEYGMKQRRFFRKRDSLSVNLHIFENSDPEAARHLRFRDYLINHPDEMNMYSDLKRKLSLTDSSDIVRYVLGKEAFVKNIDYLAAKQDTGKYWQKEVVPKKTEWSKEEIIRAMETNMHLHMTYFAKYLPIMKICYEPDITVVMANIDDDTFNYVIGARFEEKYAVERISHVLGLFKSKNLPFSWWVSERDTPKPLSSLLEGQGLSPKEDDIGMSLSLNSRTFTRRIDDLYIKQTLNQIALKDFADILVSVGRSTQVYEKVFNQIPSSLYGEGSPLEIYVGYVEEMPIVTGVLVLHANVAGIYYVMTRPEYRKRGYGTEMMISLLMRAKEKGYHMATLQASASGRGLYQKLGFESQCRFVEYASIS